MLTARQAQLLRFIEGYVAAHDGLAPTFTEMMAGIGASSKSIVDTLLCALEDRGRIRRLPRRARALQLVRDDALFSLSRDPDGTVKLDAAPQLAHALASPGGEALRREIYGCVDAALYPADGRRVA